MKLVVFSVLQDFHLSSCVFKKICINESLSLISFPPETFSRFFPVPRACCCEIIPRNVLPEAVKLGWFSPSVCTCRCALALLCTRFTSTSLSALLQQCLCFENSFLWSKDRRDKYFWFLFWLSVFLPQLRPIHEYLKHVPAHLLKSLLPSFLFLDFSSTAWGAVVVQTGAKCIPYSVGIWKVCMSSLSELISLCKNPKKWALFICHCLLSEFDKKDRKIPSAWMTKRLTKTSLCDICTRLKTVARFIGNWCSERKRFRRGFINWKTTQCFGDDFKC